MMRSIRYAFVIAVSASAVVSFTDAHAQWALASHHLKQVSAAVSIIDGISLGIRKSHQGESKLLIEANGLKATVMTRSAGKLFRERSEPVSDARIKEIVVAFE
jgi:hypothetical protein